MKQILVLTLHSGENEYCQCVLSVKQQVGVYVEHKVFSGLSNVEAHTALYSEIMKLSNKFDVFIKIDADMVLNRESALLEVASHFEKYPSLDHLVCLVNDHYTGSPIFGVHAFSSRVHWEPNLHDKLFVDQGPSFRGLQHVAPNSIPIFIEHAPNPSSFQAFHFGYHRALKAYQPDRKQKSYHRMVDQANTLLKLEVNYWKTKSRNLGLAVIASEMVSKGYLVGKSGDKLDAEVEKYFQKFEKSSDSEVSAYVSKNRLLRLMKLKAIYIVGKIFRRAQVIVAKCKKL